MRSVRLPEKSDFRWPINRTVRTSALCLTETMRVFLEKRQEKRSGRKEILSHPDGKVLGPHKGIIHYTVGQRKGLGLALGYPAFVLEIRPETNEVVVGD